MNKFNSTFFVAILFVFIGNTFAKEVTSHLELSSNHKVFYKYVEAKKGKPTIVLLNGLLYYAKSWDSYIAHLKKKGYGVLQTIYSTQLESLVLLNEEPFFGKTVYGPYGPVQVGLESQTFVDETISVVDHLGIDEFNLLSLSYGSTVSVRLAEQYKQRVRNLILVSPAIVPTNRYNPIGESRYQLFYKMKKYGPVIGYADYLYDAEFYAMLKSTILPKHLTFPGVSFKDFFNGVYQMNRAVKWFDLKELVGTDLPPTYMFQASREEENLKADQLKFWELFKNNSAKRSYVYFIHGEHALPGSSPSSMAEMTIKAISGKLTQSHYDILSK